MRISQLIIALSIVCNAGAQELKPIGNYDTNLFDYSWDATFPKSEYEAQLESPDSSLVILDRQIVSYEVGKYNVINRRRFDHKIYYVGNERDIEEVNRLYLYKGSDQTNLKVKVRTFTKAGNLVELDVSKMEDVSTDKGATNYTILAIPGIEVHSFVEVVIEKEAQPAHIRCLVRNPFKTLTAEVHLYHAPNILKLVYGPPQLRRAEYGNFSIKAEADSLLPVDSRFKTTREGSKSKGFLPTIYSAKNIAPSSSEKYSYGYDGTTRLDIVDIKYDWKEAGEGIGRNIFPDVKKYAMNGRAWLNKLEVEEEMSELKRLRMIEDFVKLTITETNGNDLYLSYTYQIWKKRIANEEGLLRMSMQLIDATEIPYVAYLCSDKDYIQADSEFPFTIGLSDVLYYFPTLEMYMAPTNDYYRLGEIPNFLASNSAISIRATDASQIGKIIQLPEAKKEYNLDGTRSFVTIDTENETTTVLKTKYFYGDNAIRSRGYYYFDDEAGRKEYTDNLLKSKLDGMELTNLVLENEAFNLNFQSADTVKYSGVLKGTDLLSSIPNGFILNPGKVIGSQTSFYDNEERKTRVYLPESKVYEHLIEVQIPEGYTVEGLDNLQFERAFKASKRWGYQEITSSRNQGELSTDESTDSVKVEDVLKIEEGQTLTEDDLEIKEDSSADSGVMAAHFKSVANLDEGVLKIRVNEFYLEGFYPKEEIESLQNVVNAAYEFYIAKIKLVKE